MSSNYYKYYQLRASPIGKAEQPIQQQGFAVQRPRNNETSPWRNNPQGPTAFSITQQIQSTIQPQVQLPQFIPQMNPNPAVFQQQQQQYSLEKQNECLRREKQELERQIEQMKVYYTKQTTIDQQELMRYEREKASLTDKLREMDSLLTGVKEMFEKEAAEERLLAKKQKQEQETKLERVTAYYGEQLAAKQEEVHKTRGNLQLAEITTTDLLAKLKLFETTNKELRGKWEEDIKTFGVELEAVNKQLLKERSRNDDLEHLMKVNKAGRIDRDIDVISRDQSELQELRKIGAEQRVKIIELEKKLAVYSERENKNSLSSAEEEKYKEKASSQRHEIDVLQRENTMLLGRLAKLEKLNHEKDQLVDQMVAHIECLERESNELQNTSNISQIESKVAQLHSENQSQKQELQFFASELERITNRNKLLEEQLYLPETQRIATVNYQLFEKQLDQIDMKCNQLKLQITSKQHNSENLVKQLQELEEAAGNARKELANGIQKRKESLKDEIEVRERQQTGDFSPQIQGFANKNAVDYHDQKNKSGQSQSLQSEFKKVTVPNRLIKVNGFDKAEGEDISLAEQFLPENHILNKQPSQIQNEQHKLEKETDNESQQTFGEGGKGVEEQREQIAEIEDLMRQQELQQQLISQNKQKEGQRIVTLSPVSLSPQLIELDIQTILNSNSTSQFAEELEGKETFDLLVGFVGASGSGKSTVIDLVRQGELNLSSKTKSCEKNLLQISHFTCVGKEVGLCESSLIGSQSFMHFICNLSQAIVLFFNSWSTQDEQLLADYLKLLLTQANFASECIVIHSDSNQLTQELINNITKGLNQLQEGLYRGKIEGKQKKINVYHLFLNRYLDSEKQSSIIEQTIAVIRGTILGKLASTKGKIDLFRRLNKFLACC